MTSVDRYLKAPRLPKTCPVTILHLQAENDVNGNPRRCYVVLTTAGRLVEVHDEGYSGDQDVKARWPWLDHQERELLKLDRVDAVSIHVKPAEYRTWIAAGENRVKYQDDETPELAFVRKLGDRCAKFHAVASALEEIRRQSAVYAMRQARAANDSRISPAEGEDLVTIYHRHPDDGGDVVSDHLRRAIGAFMRAGMVERVDYSGIRSVGRYRATDTTPSLLEIKR